MCQRRPVPGSGTTPPKKAPGCTNEKHQRTFFSMTCVRDVESQGAAPRLQKKRRVVPMRNIRGPFSPWDVPETSIPRERHHASKKSAGLPLNAVTTGTGTDNVGLLHIHPTVYMYYEYYRLSTINAWIQPVNMRRENSDLICLLPPVFISIQFFFPLFSSYIQTWDI